MSDILTDMVCEYEALRLWNSWRHPGFSVNIAGQITAGYGRLDPGGDWQFPLYPGKDYLELARESKDVQETINQ